MKPPILICASLALGFCAGLIRHQVSDSAPGTGNAPRGLSAESASNGGSDGAPSPQSSEGNPPAALSNVSAGEGFNALNFEKQRESLERLSAKLSGGGSSGDQLLLARIVNGLGFEEASGLLGALPAPGTQGAPDPSDKARRALVERMAALNPGRVLEMGRSNEDPKLAQAAILAMAQKNGADALRALAQLPEKFLSSVSAEMRGGFVDAVGKATGSLPEMAAVLQQNPQLFDVKSPGEGAVRRLLGQVASQAAAADPAGAMAEIRKLAASMAQVKPGEDPSAAQSAIVARIASQVTRTLRADAVGSERVVFNSLLDSEKNDTMVALEAASRFRESGADSAIQFAESQSKDQLTKTAASGVWWSLAQQDRAGALKWIESLPQGAFRDGALSSLMQESAFRTRSFGETEEVVRAGAELSSPATKLDYFSMVTAQRRSPGVSQSEFIASLPISEAEKNELRRRVAPIKGR